MKSDRGFDEVMIVNPGEPGLNQGERLMRFHYAEPPEMGFYAEPPEGYGYFAEDPYGDYAEPPEGYGYFAEDPYGDYGELPEGYGYFAEDPYGGYAEPPEGYGYFAEDPYGYYAELPEGYGYLAEEPYGDLPWAGYGEMEPVGYFAEEAPYGQYEPVGWYGQVPEMVGYGEMEPLAEDYPGMAYYADPGVAGYVRDLPSPFNAGCPMPTNVAGFGEPQPLEGYMRPAEVSPSCRDFASQPGPTPAVPDTFKPLW